MAQVVTPKVEKPQAASKLLYILVQDDPEPGAKEGEQGPTHRYTRGMLQSTLQFMGCKARHATKISDQVFEVIMSQMPPKKPKRARFPGLDEVPKKDEKPTLYDPKGFVVSPKPLKKRSTATVPREKFLDVVCDGLKKYKYHGVKQRMDLMVACRIREKRSSVTVLLCGTSGCGKSTLATLLGQRLGVTTVVSTDSVRHMMRGFISEQENPLLWASTYHAGEFLDSQAVAEAIRVKRENMLAKLALKTAAANTETPEGPNNTGDTSEGSSHELEVASESVDPKVMAIEGYKAQSEMVVDSVDRLITSWESRKESVVVEGVHLSINFVMKLMKKHPSIIPFMVYIAKEEKHMQRFAVRAKQMTTDPTKNKYVKYIKNIRTIQDYLCRGADKHFVPKVNNTNVDKSVAAIHSTIFNCLRRREAGESLFDPKTKSSKIIHDEYNKQFASSALGSKNMYKLIQRKSSSRNLLAVVRCDGTVEKAWPLVIQVARPSPGSLFESRGVGTPMVGPLSVVSSEPVRLAFGELDLNEWLKKDPRKTSEPQEPSSAAVQEENGAGSSSSKTPLNEKSKDAEVSGSEDEYDEEEEAVKNQKETPENEKEDSDEEGSVDGGSDRSEGEDDFIEGEEDDAYWVYDEPTPTATGTPGSKSERMSRLRSFDRAAAGRGAPELRKVVSYNRASSKRHPPKRT
ncbi:P-loop NTPase domain-containing protein LPA1 homolog 1 [Physcomitrium patens]|uniref:2-phosphoglycerate kinase n=1 Tax=Physcomitrium patens TaxID=3218 RepID=A0A2K1L0K8_PHYPA|nr:P-loop NTPase domain-containing protein LPA1 homolog 1-like [Physcomitrium patens]XP_024368091.1 P-loop NTPase domain-containing protein LPA1 homolog 1-like [Physcomitrium patens]XP_024368092.1 P-loop NTPase domain-containing protein LPA1 homolog 1-like [Physcomitrium patens]XP_024368093.1 P-loop NTPase domain-containing protein LPA1 homolog 1-like [Physcomitrium patens]PNR59557.1 hypothetical protein PHYPA_002348 [Physcomitrium patens]|eukprot:XP_024368090.1 P-loop NTPase domain-containing protein LPA1 homolog 1-like [Physcomitrella patens]